MKNAPDEKYGWFQTHQWLKSPRLLALSYILAVLFFVVLCVLLHFVSPPEEPFIPSVGCVQSQLYGVIIQGVLAVVALTFYVVKLWNINDAFYIKREMILILAGVPLLFLLFVLSFIFSWGVAEDVFMFLSTTYVMCVTLYYPSALAILELRKNARDEDLHPLRKSMSGEELYYRAEDTFKSYLQEEETLVLFIKFCVKSWCVENVLFYLQVEKFNKLEDTPEALTPAAELIISRYIVPGAPLDINIEDHVRGPILEQAKKNEFSKDMFLKAQLHIFRVMYQDTYSKWKRTKEFRAIVPEGQTVKSIQSLQQGKGKKKKRKSSKGSDNSPDILGDLDIKMEELIDPDQPKEF